MVGAKYISMFNTHQQQQQISIINEAWMNNAFSNKLQNQNFYGHPSSSASSHSQHPLPYNFPRWSVSSTNWPSFTTVYLTHIAHLRASWDIGGDEDEENDVRNSRDLRVGSRSTMVCTNSPPTKSMVKSTPSRHVFTAQWFLLTLVLQEILLGTCDPHLVLVVWTCLWWT